MIGELVGGTKEVCYIYQCYKNHKCSHTPLTQACTPADSKIRHTQISLFMYWKYWGSNSDPCVRGWVFKGKTLFMKTIRPNAWNLSDFAKTTWKHNLSWFTWSLREKKITRLKISIMNYDKSVFIRPVSRDETIASLVVHNVHKVCV